MTAELPPILQIVPEPSIVRNQFHISWRFGIKGGPSHRLFAEGVGRRSVKALPTMPLRQPRLVTGLLELQVALTLLDRQVALQLLHHAQADRQV